MFDVYFCCRPAPYCYEYSPPTVADTIDQTNLPVAMFPPVNCRYTHGEFADLFYLFLVMFVAHFKLRYYLILMCLILCVFQDGCYSEGADQPSEGSVPRSQKKGDPLQLCHCLPRPQRESVQVCITSCHLLTGLVHLCVPYIKTCACPMFQVERCRQHRIWQEGRGRLHDVAVSALPDWRLSGHRDHAT